MVSASLLCGVMKRELFHKGKFAETFFNNIMLKKLVWHSHIFLLPYITVEEHIIISITFMFNFYILYIVVEEVTAFIIIVCNFLT